MNTFRQAMQEAEDRKARNRHDNLNATSLLIRFSVRGWHEGRAFTNDVVLYRMILSVIFNKAR